MKVLKLCAALLIAGVLFGARGWCQVPGGEQAVINAALLKLFGKTTAFSGASDLQMRDKAQKETLSMTMNFAMLDGKIRAEIDLTKVKTAQLPAELLPLLKQVGLHRLVTIVRPDKQATVVIYPGLKAYAEVPMSKEEADALSKTYKVEKTRLAAETIDGHACIKSKVTVSDGNDLQESIVWNATDLKDFPIKIELKQAEGTVVIQYKDIKLSKPDAKQFDTPGGLTRHDDVQAMMQGAMMKLLGGGNK